MDNSLLAVRDINHKYIVVGRGTKIFYLTKNIWNSILLDFKQPISYLIPAIIITVFLATIYKIYRRGRVRITFASLLLIIYIQVVLQTAFFSREPGSRTQMDLRLFGTWGETPIAYAYFIENIIMFIPFGVLMPMVFKRRKKLRYCVFAGFLFSCIIEISQLITQRGFCQLDDVVTNTVGTLVGWGIWYCGNYFIESRRNNFG